MIPFASLLMNDVVADAFRRDVVPALAHFPYFFVRFSLSFPQISVRKMSSPFFLNATAPAILSISFNTHPCSCLKFDIPARWLFCARRFFFSVVLQASSQTPSPPQCASGGTSLVPSLKNSPGAFPGYHSLSNPVPFLHTLEPPGI